ncbi:unnamed protein product [Mucor circinelloides]
MTKSIKQTSNKNKKGVEELSSTKLQEDADEVVLVLDNGDEVKSDTQYQLYQWMYNKVDIYPILIFSYTYYLTLTYNTI